MQNLRWLALLLLCSCATGPATYTWRPEAPLRWPPPGEQARIELLFGYHGPADTDRDLPTGEWITDWILGPPEVGLVSPFGMDLTADNTLLVADTARAAIHRIHLPSGAHDLITGSDASPLVTPIGVAAVPDGRFFVADSSTGKIVAFSPDGTVSEASFGSDLKLQRPTGLCYDPSGQRLLVVDTLGCSVHALSLSGEVQASTGHRGDGPGEFNFPIGVSTGPDGDIYIVDSMNFRVQRLAADFSFVSEFGIAGNGPGSFTKPKGVALDSEGHIYVVDSMFDNVQVFDEDGNLLLAFGSGGSALGQLYLPTGLFIDDSDRIFVADTGNARFQTFQYFRDTP